MAFLIPTPSDPHSEAGLRALSEAATPGPWRGGHRCDGAIRSTVNGERVGICSEMSAADAAFTARLENDYRAGTLVPAAASPSEPALSQGAGEDDDRCIACDEPLQEGQMVLPDVSGGYLHTACAGPEREGYCGADGEPLKDGEPIPEGSPWEPWPESAAAPAPTTPVATTGALIEALNTLRKIVGPVAISYNAEEAQAALRLVEQHIASLKAGQPDAGGGWQPIETAPKDGTRFLARDEDGNLFGASYDPSDLSVGILCHCGQYVTQPPEAVAWMPAPPLATLDRPAPGQAGETA